MVSTLSIEALIRRLAHYRVRYVLFGTLGAIAYGADLATHDRDICPATDGATLRRLSDLLAEWRAKPRHAPGHTDEAACKAWTPEPLSADRFDHDFVTPFGALDIVPAPYGPHGNADRFTYDRLDACATTLMVFGCSIHLAHVDDLIASKMSRRRLKDLCAEGELLRMRERVLRGQWQPGLVRYATAHMRERGGE